MVRYIKAENAVKVADYECGEFRGIFGRIKEQLETMSTVDEEKIATEYCMKHGLVMISMDDLISRQAAIKLAIDLDYESRGLLKESKCREIENRYNAIPPMQEDPEWIKEHYKAAYNQGFVDGCKMHEKEQKKGKWISIRTGGSGKSTTVKLYPICSECGFEHSPVNYCPNCGVKMDSWIVDFAMTAEGANDV